MRKAEREGDRIEAEFRESKLARIDEWFFKHDLDMGDFIE
jgi:hypothetical protein